MAETNSFKSSALRAAIIPAIPCKQYEMLNKMSVQLAWLLIYPTAGCGLA
jgi:hypothetical protein